MFKKSLCIIISILFLCLQLSQACFAKALIEDKVVAEFFKGQPFSRPIYKAALIEDEIATAAFKGKHLSKPVYTPEIIEDKIAQKTFKDQKLSKYIFKLHIIEDKIVTNSYKDKKLSKPVYKYTVLEDRVALDSFKGQKLKKTVFKYNLLDEDTIDIEVTVSALSEIKTSHAHFEIIESKHTGSGKFDIGDKVSFRIKNDVIKDGKLLIRKGTLVKAIVGNIVPSSNRGAPAEVTVERFITRDINGNKVELAGEIKKRGINLYLPYFILAVAGTPFTFGASQALLYMHGGQAKIKYGEEFTLYYEN